MSGPPPPPWLEGSPMPDLSVPTQNVREGNVVEAGAVRTLLGATAEVRLFKSTFAPSPTKVDADFAAAECDFHGYAHVVVATWDPVGIDPATPVAFFTNGTSLFFQNDDGSTGNDVGGAWLRHKPAMGGPFVVEYVVFDPPVPMSVALAAINMEWRLNFPGPGEVSYSY